MPRAALGPRSRSIGRHALTITTAAAAAVTLAAGPSPARAQDSAGVAVHHIRWYEPVAVGGGIALVSLIDEPVADHLRTHHSATGGDLAKAAREFGGPYVYLPVTAGILVGGLASHNQAVAKAGVRLAATLGLAGATGFGMKFVVGRLRPNETTESYQFKPFTSDRAFPSGHSTMAFAMAASLSDDIQRGWATTGLYGAATAVAVASVYQEEHWVSDVAGGAAVGIAAAKLASGRWRVFGIRPPAFLMGPAGTAVGWHLTFHE